MGTNEALLRRQLAEQFCQALGALGGEPAVAASLREAAAMALAALRRRGVTEVVAWSDPLLEASGLPQAVQAEGIAWLEPGGAEGPEAFRAAAARAGAGVTGADAAVAELGTLVLHSGPGRARSVSLVPPVHIALVDARTLVPSLSDLIRQQALAAAAGNVPSSVNLITGPSRTADIEHILVRKAHGPGEVVAIVVLEL